MKRILALVLVFIMAFPMCAFAQEGDISVELNGQLLAFDVPPQLINDRTMVPMRAIFENLGANVEWQEVGQVIIATKDADIITMQIGLNSLIVQNVISGDKKEVELDVPPQVINDRTLVPVRAIAESLNATVGWVDETQTVVITTNMIVAEQTSDYSKYIGQWHKVDPDQLNGDVILDVIGVDGNTMTFCIDNGDVQTKSITNNQIKWNEEWADGDMGLTLTFNDNSIHLEYSRVAIEWYDEIEFVR